MSSFENQLDQVTELISLPEVYLKFRQLMDDPASDLDDFAAIVRLDPNLSAKLLHVVNSAYFGFAGQISSIPRAVNMIGLGQLHVMVLGISAVSSLNFPNDIVPLKTFWRSSLLAATLARLLAVESRIRANERLFILGLLHEIGHLVLYAKFPEHARQAARLAEEKALRSHQAEKQLLGCHYGDIGARLMGQWKLSEDFQNITRLQPTPEQASEDQLQVALLHIAHAYAHKQFITTESDLAELIDPVAWETSQLTAETVDQLLESALVTSAEMEKVILQ